MTQTKEGGAGSVTKATWSVLVIYEDDAARDRAVGFCDQLVDRFWAKCDFEVSWWPFALLKETISAREAALKASCADLILFSSTPEGDFPPAVKAWIETWRNKRGDREGLLIGLMDSPAAAADREGQKHHCLRNAAHHGAMDYLTQVPQDIALSIPDSLDSYTQRAHQVTSLLDEILHQHLPPPGRLS
jgi:hypothetical protein